MNIFKRRKFTITKNVDPYAGFIEYTNTAANPVMSLNILEIIVQDIPGDISDIRIVSTDVLWCIWARDLSCVVGPLAWEAPFRMQRTCVCPK